MARVRHLHLQIGQRYCIGGNCEKTNKDYLESSLAELKDLFKENYQNNKIIHLIV